MTDIALCLVIYEATDARAVWSFIPNFRGFFVPLAASLRLYLLIAIMLRARMKESFVYGRKFRQSYCTLARIACGCTRQRSRPSVEQA